MSTSHERKDIPNTQLVFDHKNPRLAGESFSSSNETPIIQHLCATSDIAELVISILKNGFVDFEPIVVIEDTANTYRVLEGNRRLAAIRLLLNPALSESLEQTLKYHIDRPIQQDILDSIENIPTIVVQNEKDTQAYIGFKHINGPHKWTSFAKATFVTQWFKQGIPLDEIAQHVGDKNQMVKDLIAGMLVLEQAEQEEIFEISDRTKRGVFGFSHLYTALNRKEYRQYLGLKKDWTDNMSENPIDNEHLGELETTLKYMYGSKSRNIESVIKSQNPNLRELGQVLAHPVARQTLIENNSLSTALEETEKKSALFEKSLISAHIQLQKAATLVTQYDGNTYLLETAKEMEGALTLLVKNMETVANE